MSSSGMITSRCERERFLRSHALPFEVSSTVSIRYLAWDLQRFCWLASRQELLGKHTANLQHSLPSRQTKVKLACRLRTNNRRYCVRKIEVVDIFYNDIFQVRHSMVETGTNLTPNHDPCIPNSFEIFETQRALWRQEGL